ncbi:MAG TPA: hypothetical protein VHU19_14350 [Pyrinomonadaceae bacterium]|nr:hypothetical protein [Pyrinomonadaceae bacterium]
MADDLTTDEVAEFGDIFAEIDHAKARLERAAQMLVQRGYRERAHKLLGTAQVADSQKYLLVQDWRQKPAA